MADGVRIVTETQLPFAAIGNSLISGVGGDEISAAKLEHTLDLVFGFGVDDAAAMPSGTTNWTMLRPRRAGVITSVQVWMVDTGTTGTANTVDVLKNDATILTGAVSISHADADNTLKSGTLTTSSGVAFAADDRIKIQGVKGTNNGVGIKVRILGRYIGS